MMTFQRFYEHMFFCKDFYREMAKTPAQERGLLLLGAAIAKFDKEAIMVAMHDKGENIVIVMARHRPPFWSALYSNAISDAIAGGDYAAAHHTIHVDWKLRLRIELSQSSLGPAWFVYRDGLFPAVAMFLPNWEKIYDTITELGYTPKDIIHEGCNVHGGHISMYDGHSVALGRGCYMLPPEDARQNAKPAEKPAEDPKPLFDIHAARGK